MKRDGKGRFISEGKIIKKICLRCGKEFHAYSFRKYCSLKCSAKSKIVKMINVENVKLNEDLAYILGVLCGDGSISAGKNGNYEIRLASIDKEFVLNFKSKLNKIYNQKLKIRILPSTLHEIRGKVYKCKKQFEVKIYSKLIFENLITYGKFKTSSWRVPKEIINCSDEKIVCSFLKGFIDSEGTIRDYCMEIASINKRGLNDVKKLLSLIGMNRPYFYQDWKGIWKLIFSGKDNLFIFHKRVGFSIRRKQIKLKSAIKYRMKAKNFKSQFYSIALSLRKKGLTYNQISKQLKINRDTIRSWCARGSIPYEIRRQLGYQNKMR